MIFRKKKDRFDFAEKVYKDVNKLLSRLRKNDATGELTHVNLKDLKCTRVLLHVDYDGKLVPTQLTVILSGLHSDASSENIPVLMKVIRDVAHQSAPVRVVLAKEEKQ